MELATRLSIVPAVPADGIIIAASPKEKPTPAPANIVVPEDRARVSVNIGIFDVVLGVKTRLMFTGVCGADALLVAIVTATLSPALTLKLFVVLLHVGSVSDIVQVRLVSTSFF